MKTLKSIETLRIFAALLVVSAHTPPINIPFIGLFLGDSLFLGSIGVDLFFVISGLVIGLSSVRYLSKKAGQHSCRRFLLTRLFRILPLYWAVTLLKIILLWFKDSAVPGVNEIFHSLLLIPRFDQFQYVDPIVYVGWTLQFELFFYGLCAIAITFRSPLFPPIAAIGLSIASMYWDLYYFNPILLEFAGGYMLALYLSALDPSTQLSRCREIFLVVAVTSVFILASIGRDFGYPASLNYTVPRMMIAYGDMLIPRWIAWGIPALCVVAVAYRLEYFIRWPFVYLGKYTYSVYLCHGMLIAALLSFLNHFGLNPGLILLTLPIALVVVSLFAYHLLEKPMISTGKRISDRMI